ncbi:hypothetical protein D5R40_01725 [Okeania hirsuta]|uniref:Uncharacterized protein n=1 Tax=Okeania hirsuta TaxID=1458930 RepID=A0A3N6QU86_9CYAN|nr:hypothetical protein D4Z78_11065 [Okeania hirsuta]RQH55516.1 hypothetical protein D5R40_01725 [Okeania hirsuta]
MGYKIKNFSKNCSIVCYNQQYRHCEIYNPQIAANLGMRSYLLVNLAEITTENNFYLDLLDKVGLFLCRRSKKLYQIDKCLLQIDRIFLRNQESGVRSQNEWLQYHF